ncbi:MAG: caspase family protein [Saprospiraceae bacterium]|nr:caspase family protein [Saprospiraceae bacterium]MCF8251562.1 caspase family protein [Saprospiraceae bacterium]MCF8310928.1 caspase family protein [Saprospiraceae bacterium]MCF8439736.1 caspase family protein [Saprospiraceae bacterium]
MKITTILFLCLLLHGLCAQPPSTSSKGVGALAAATAWPGISKALVIGISNYQDDGIPDLKYADRDAKEFIKYLKSKGGGGLEDNQIRLLTNEQATYAQIYAELDWLIENCGPDDQAVIYFSGHGDVETRIKRQKGFLLAYDTPPTNYMIGALRLDDLNGYLETLVDQKSKIIVITDACHSGNLAGGMEGVGATAQALSAQFQNQIKIMSCQPNELSMEGEQWGGGRGVFSYHLIDGLTGMADANKDSIVTLSELERYLDQTVPAETDQHQYPNATGMKGAKLVTVDPAELMRLIAERATPQQMKLVAPKGLETAILAAADTSVQQLYGEFLAAVNSHYFLPSDVKPGRHSGKSASELYDRLSKEEALAPMH